MNAYRICAYCCACLILAAAPPAGAADRHVAAPGDLDTALSGLQPGDTVTLASGVWRDVVIDLAGTGTAEAPITLRAAEPGKAIITGRSALMISGEYIVAEGLNFQSVEPPDNPGAVVYFRSSNKKPAYRSRLVDSLIENCNPADGVRRYPWVAMVGRENEIDRCRFVGQNHSGVTVQIRLDEEFANHRIRRSHFLDRPPGDGNGFESIQIGQSQDSMKVGGCLIEDNVFEACDGETEIVSVKTCENIVRHNLFLRSAGTLTLRHGNRNVAENNIFLGEGKRDSGGIRVIGEDHRISGNYFEGLVGRTGGIVVLYLGIPDSPLNGYFAAHRAIVENNIFVDNKGVALFLNGGVGGRGRTILPENVAIRNNIIRQIPSGGASAVGGALPDATFDSNLYDDETELGRTDTSGFHRSDVSLETRPGGTRAVTVVEPNGEKSRTAEPPAPLNLKEIGPSWDARLPRLVLWNKHRLNEFRRAASGEIADGRDRLIADAAEIIDAGTLYSVTFNERTPPSGDIRDYYSTGPYWWPDPESPDGLPYIRRDGEFNPERDRVSDRDPLFSMVHDTRLCTLAYFATGDEQFAAHALALVRTWFLDPVTGMRPNLNHAQAIPGRTDGRGTGIIDAHPFAELMDALLILERSPAMTGAEKVALRDWFDAYAKWLGHHPNGHHERGAINNHGTAFDLQLAAICRYVGRDLEVADILSNSVAARIDSQLDADGTQPHELSRTRTWSYCTENLEHFSKLGAIGLNSGIDIFEIRGEDGAGLRAALDYLLPYVCEPEAWPHRQDTEWQTEFIRNVLSIAEGAYDDPRYAEARACLDTSRQDSLAALLAP